MPPHQLLFEQTQQRVAPDVFLNGKPPGARAPSNSRTPLQGPTPAPGSGPPCGQIAFVRLRFKMGWRGCLIGHQSQFGQGTAAGAPTPQVHGQLPGQRHHRFLAERRGCGHPGDEFAPGMPERLIP